MREEEERRAAEVARVAEMQRLEMELIQRLQDTTTLQQQAYSQLERALQG